MAARTCHAAARLNRRHWVEDPAANELLSGGARNAKPPDFIARADARNPIWIAELERTVCCGRARLPPRRVATRGSHDVRAFANFNSFEHAVLQVTDIVKQNEGWLKSQRQDRGPGGTSATGANPIGPGQNRPAMPDGLPGQAGVVDGASPFLSDPSRRGPDGSCVPRAPRPPRENRSPAAGNRAQRGGKDRPGRNGAWPVLPGRPDGGSGGALWGIAVVLIYAMRRVECAACGVKVERVPWAAGRHQLTWSYVWFLARWARRLSWAEVARIFSTSWPTVFRAVEVAVEWGRARTICPV